MTAGEGGQRQLKKQVTAYSLTTGDGSCDGGQWVLQRPVNAALMAGDCRFGMARARDDVVI